jgi:2-octaprenyl-6-methoxyphenol hydroxylase
MDADVIIVGAGLVGTSLVAALDKDVRIIVLEQHLPDFSTTQSDRPLSLAYGSQRLLQRWGLWRHLAQDACSIDKVHVSEQGRFGVSQFTATQQGVPALGYVVSYNALHQALYHHLSQQANVMIIHSHEIKEIVCNESQASVCFVGAKEERTLTASLLVAADGQRSCCRERMGISVQSNTDLGSALVLQLALSASHNHVAYERFTKMGAMAVLPLFSEYQARLVWTCSKEDAQQIQQWTDDQLLQYVQAVFSGRLCMTACDRQQQFSLQTMIAQQQIARRFVLLGNAAHSIFPVAAQGFNLALRDVRALSEVLNQGYQAQQDLGAGSQLQKYLDLREQDQKRTMAITQGTQTLFESQLPGLGLLRGMGLLSFDMFSVLKKRFAKRLMGLL